MTGGEREARFESQAARAALSVEVFQSDLLSELPNDYGNAQRLIKLHGGDLRYCHGFKKWLVWSDGRWITDEVGRARHLAKKAMLRFLEQAVTASDRIGEKFAKSSLNEKDIRAMLSMAESDLYVLASDLDANPDLLNVANGTVHLPSGKLQPHDRNDFITKIVHHDFNPDAQCTRWLAFLNRILGGGPDAGEGDLDRAERLVSYLQTALGYSLTGRTSSKAVFVPFGDGNNGKTTMLSTFAAVIAEFASSLAVDTLMVRQESNNSQADLADLRGARFVQTSETEEGQRLAQGKLKRITQGMGRIKAVRKYENPIEFSESHKLWMDTNRRPTIRDAEDKATFNRLHPIPFTVTIPPEEIDRELPGKLAAEAEGILAWAIVGAMRWYADGLPKPPEVEAANETWRSESDQLGHFIEERCKTGEYYSIQANKLFAEYRRWCEESEERPMTSTAFGRRMTERGIQRKHSETGWRYMGIVTDGS